MISSLSLKNTKLSTIMLVVVFIITLIFQTTVLFYNIDVDFKDRLSFLQKQGIPKLDNQSKLISDRINLVKTYTELLAHELSDFKECDEGKISHMIKGHTIKEFGMFQVRLLSSKGMELIRYDLVGDNLIKVLDLQDKSNRYYFQEAKDIKLNDIYISKLDLNVEYGKIVEPHQNTVRLVKKIKINNEIFYLIINYDLSKILASTFKTTLYDIFLIEKDNQINFHLNHNYCFSAQRNLKLYLKDLISYENQYITKKSLDDFPYEMVIMIKKSQLANLHNKKNLAQNKALYTSALISFLIVFILFVIFQYAYKLSINRNLKSINQDLEETVNNEVEKNIKTEQQLLQKSRLAQMGELISMIAHQWRQPLNAIAIATINMRFNIELDKYDLDTKKGQEQQREYFLENLINIEDFVQTLSNIIEDFRSFYKPDKKVVKTTLEIVCDKSLGIVKSSLVSDRINVTQNYNSTENIEMYDGEIMQVILNILKNAQDNFNEKEIENPQIIITTDKNTISICDNGGGIPEDIMDQIFDPYFSTKDEKNGTGLGLYMSKKIVEDHHSGKLLIENINGGVCFTVEIGELKSSDI